MGLAIGAETDAPKPSGCFSTTTATTYRGLSAGAKGPNQARQIVPGPGSAVPVSPAPLGLGGDPTLAAVPACTTSCISWFSSAAVEGLIGWPSFCGAVFVTVEPSAATTFCTRYGLGTTPLLAIVAPTIAIWSGVASMLNCPNASRPWSI